MNTPASPDHGVTFDLESVARELRDDQRYLNEGQAARTLIRTPDLRIVLIVLKAGKTISEHHADVTAAVQTLSGHIRLQLPDRNVDVPQGRLLVLGAGLAHDVYAHADSTFLLTLGWTDGKQTGFRPKRCSFASRCMLKRALFLAALLQRRLSTSFRFKDLKGNVPRKSEFIE